MNMEKLYSYHVFLFPFQWFYTGRQYYGKTFEEKTNLAFFTHLLKGTQWIRKGFTPDTILKYNEYNYFYDFARDILYDRDIQANDGILAHYEYGVAPETWMYRIVINKDGMLKEYKLHVDSIVLHLYNTGVGVLSFHLNNRLKEQSSQEDILNINQYGRRVYPPFFGLNPSFVGSQSQFEQMDFAAGLNSTQQKELPVRISFDDETYGEDFSRYIDAAYFRDNPFRLPAHFEHLFKNIPLTTTQKSETSETKIFLSPLLDDRMFVVCWYGNDDVSDQLKSKKIEEKYVFPFKNDDWWYKYVFVDTNLKTCQNEEMQIKLLEKHTNFRWSNFGTLYGVSRYSFVCLTSELDTLKKPNNNAAFLVNHVQTMYYKLAELCLVQRACLLRFSDEVAEISGMQKAHRKKLADHVSSLYKQYIRFVNRIYFREVTAQEQGIELYNLLQEHMGIPDNVKDLDKEIEELHNYVIMKEQARQTVEVNMLTWIATLLLPPTLVAGYFGMNIKDSSGDDWAFSGISAKPFWPFWMLVAVSIIFMCLVVFLVRIYLKKSFKTIS